MNEVASDLFLYADSAWQATGTIAFILFGIILPLALIFIIVWHLKHKITKTTETKNEK